MNISNRITELAQKIPNKTATIYPKKKFPFFSSEYDYQSINFEKLERLSNQYANGLIQSGLKAGDKTLLFVRPCIEFHALVFGLFKAGIVPILIDPGMGKDNLLKAIAESSPKAMVAEPIVHLISYFYPQVFKSIAVKVSTKNIPLTSVKSFKNWETLPKTFSTYQSNEKDLAAILFTSGGTGKPKGVEYTHEIFDQQTTTLQSMFELTDQDVDLPGFPLFSLFTLAMGMSSCIPDMNPSKPAKCSAKKLVKNINDTKATFLAGSPAIWARVANYCELHNIQLPSVRILAMFGAPVANRVHQQFSKILTNGTTYTPYGATESLPVANISGKEILERTAAKTDSGSGTCVGTPAPGMEIRIISITDESINHISETTELSANQKGEIIVKGTVVTKAYHANQQANTKAKIYDDNGFWHRMGDIGYLDEEGQLWFCGRKTHRVQTKKEMMFPAPIEGIFNNHPMVSRSAFIGLGKAGEQIPAIVIQADPTQMVRKDHLTRDLQQLAEQHETTKEIKQIYFTENFPVDIRHNIKIDRLKLKQQAEDGLL